MVVGVGSVSAIDPREDLVDLLASDQIDRVDFVATTFEAAMSRVERVADQVITRGSEVFESPEETSEVCKHVIASLNTFRPRTEGYVTGELLFVILDVDDADALAELIVTTAQLVDSDSKARITPGPSAETLLRGVVIDIEAGISPVDQLLEHVRVVAALPADQQAKYFK